MRRWPERILCLALALGVVGCAEPTALLVFVDSDMTLDRVVVEVSGTDGVAAPDSRTVDFTGGPRPVRLTLVPQSGHRVGQMVDLEIEVKGFAPGATDATVERTAITRFVDGQTLFLEMYLFDVCAGFACPDGQTCVATADSTTGDCDEEATTGLRYQSDPAPIGATSRPDGGTAPCDATCWHVCGDATTCETPAQLALGGAHSCARTVEGNVYCWGLGDLGQLGHTSAEQRPARVQGLPGPIVDVGAGERHSCAVTDAGALYCWGSNENAELGRELIESRTFASPILPNGINPDERVTQVGVGRYQTCARVEPPGGAPVEVRCFGLNAFGAAGSEPPGRLVPVARTVMDVNDAVSVHVGHEHACAVVDEGPTNEVVCWGSTELGRLGNGVIAAGTETTGQPVLGGGGNLAGVVQLAVGVRNSCALRADGSVRCWGPNEDRELGTDNGDETAPFLYDATATSFPSLPGGAEIPGWSSVDMGLRQGCGILDGTVRCWGWTNDGALGVAGAEHVPPTAVTTSAEGTATEVAVGGGRDPADRFMDVTHACAIIDAAIWCWGDNASGQLGLGPGAPVLLTAPRRLGAQ